MSEPFLAQIILFGANFAPRAWVFCDNQILPINQYQSVYSLVGTTYGGDGRTSFGIPGLRGRYPVGEGDGTKLGQKAGAETNTLTQQQLPSHTHVASGKTMNCFDATSNQRAPVNNYLAADATTAGADRRYHASSDGSTMNNDAVTVTVQNAGGGQAINNMQPYLALNYIFCMQGVFPSRN